MTQTIREQMRIDTHSKIVDWISPILAPVIIWMWVINTGKYLHWQDLQNISMLTIAVFFIPLVLAVFSTIRLVRHRATEVCIFDRERRLVLLQQRSVWGALSQVQYPLTAIRDIKIKCYSGEDSYNFRIMLDLDKCSKPIALSGFTSEEKRLSQQLDAMREFLRLPEKLSYK